MKTKLLLTLFFVFTLVGTVVGTVSALPFTLTSLELNGVELTEDGVNKLSVERGSEVELKLLLTASEDTSNFEVRAFISGYEYNDVERIEDLSTLGNLEAGVTYSRFLKLKLSDLVESDTYKLRVVFSDRTGDLAVKNYNIKVDVPRHALKVQDVIFYPSERVKAGHALLTTVRVENKGEKDEKDVKVTVSLPALGLTTSGYIEEIETGDEEEQTEELYLRLDKCVKPGDYQLNVDVSYDKLHRSLTPVTKTVTVEGNEACESTSRAAELTVSSTTENLKRGSSVSYPVTVTNKGRTQQSFTVLVNSPLGFQVSVTPSNTVLLNSGASQTFNVVLSANDNTPLGVQSLNLKVNSGDQVLKEFAVSAQVSEDENEQDLTSFLEIGLLVLVVVLVVLGLLIGLTRRRRKEEYY